MTTPSFIIKNALRNKRRALLTTGSVAVSLFLLVTLLVGLRELTLPMQDAEAVTRIIVRNRISLANLLPERQRPIIERIPGVEAVTPFTWYGARYKNEEATTFAQFAMDASLFPVLMADAEVPPEDLRRFIQGRRNCLVGKITAEKYGMQVGDKLPLMGTFWPVNLTLEIAGIYEGTIDDRNVFFHHEFLDESVGGLGQVGTWWVKATSPEVVPEVVKRINEAFENSSAQVRAETERAFQLSFVSMWGNIRVLVHSISSVVVFTLVLVTGSTMSMAIRERFRELAMLKTLGFRRRELLGFILAESLGLAAVGALAGVGGAWVIYTYGDVAAMTKNIFLVFEVTPHIIGVACFVALLLGVLASIAPGIAVARMTVVEGLKTLD